MFGNLFNFSKVHKYSLSVTLQGHDRPINCLAFTPAGDVMASGGDDEEVQIWDLASYSQLQTLNDPAGNWGQVTCLTFLNCGAGPGSADWLCIGTGRGHIVIYQRKRKLTTFIEISSMRAFSPGDSIESIAFDAKYLRLVATSHYGRITMFKYSLGKLTELWSMEDNDYIPRAVRFADNGENVVVYGLENGIVLCRDAETATEKYTKSLKTSIGNARECPTTGYVIVDNMEDGFDLYPPSRVSPTLEFKVPTSRRFVKKAVFGERGRVIACGSDHGLVYLFSPEETSPVQVLKHGEDSELIQTVETVTTDEHHIIATASAGPNFLIRLWKQPVKKTRVVPTKRKQNKVVGGSALLRIMVALNVALFFVVVWSVCGGSWVSFLNPDAQSGSSTLSKMYNSIQDIIQPSSPYRRRVTIVEPPSLARVITSLDDESLRRILGMSRPSDDAEVSEN
ncbi:WD40-repeat-containing domain protein [Pholiota molesta]|nr:WD40-repeat-containing domain protein [Pholiota molesta]KAF8204552.1 WD40-repeat-containing domain protein [Pholiota molesta]